MTKDYFQYRPKSPEPSMPNTSGVTPPHAWHTARHEARPLGIDPPLLVGPIVRCHNQRFQAWNFGRRESPRARKHALGDPWRAPNVSPSSGGSILSLSSSHRPAPPSSSADLLPYRIIPVTRQKRVTRKPPKPFFYLFLLFGGMILFPGCNGFEFKSGMFDFKVNDHHHDAHPRNDSNSTGTLE